MDTYAFVYKWTHLPTGKWYIGSRSAAGCHPDDGYICSSKIVKPMILENREEWKLTLSERSQGRVHTPETKAKMSTSAKGKRAAKWQVTDPKGDVFEVLHMPDFCAATFDFPNSALKHIRYFRSYKDYHFVKL